MLINVLISISFLFHGEFLFISRKTFSTWHFFHSVFWWNFGSTWISFRASHQLAFVRAPTWSGRSDAERGSGKQLHVGWLREYSRRGATVSLLIKSRTAQSLLLEPQLMLSRRGEYCVMLELNIGRLRVVATDAVTDRNVNVNWVWTLGFTHVRYRAGSLPARRQPGLKCRRL